MKGRITEYNSAESKGTIAAFDTMRYGFSRADWRSEDEPTAGLDVEFLIDGTSAKEVILRGRGARQSPDERTSAPRLSNAVRQSRQQRAEPESTWNVLAPDMEFGQAVRTCLKKSLTFTGRARRAEFWYFALFGSLLSVFVTIIWVFGGGDISQPVSAQNILRVALFLPSLAVLVRRLHDCDRTGYWVLLTYAPLLAIVGLRYSGIESANPSSFVRLLLALGGTAWAALTIWIFIQTVTAGTLGPNRYGPDPLSSPEKAS